MRTRIQYLLEQYDAEGDVEAATGLRREVRRHRLMLAGRAAQWFALTLAAAIAAADLVQVRLSSTGLGWNFGHVDESPHHWLWVPLAMVTVAAIAFRRACSDE